MVNRVLAQIYLIVSPVGPQTHPVVNLQVPECIIGIDILSCWKNSYIPSLTCGVRAIMMEKAKGKPLELPLHRDIVNQKQYHIP